MRLLVLALLMLGACGDDTDTDSGEPSAAAADASWEEISEDDLFDDDKDTGKGDDICGEEVIEGEPCAGDWTETLCVDEYGEWWWCEDGVWTSDKDS
jgi:hypothetical protein